MRSVDAVSYFLLAALWGGSFLFMRVAAPEFGPFPLMLMRCSIGALVLLPVCLWRGRLAALLGSARPIAMVGMINSAIPFALFGYAALTLPSGIISVLNSTTPFFGALMAFFWLRERLAGWQIVGMALGFGGVVLLIAGGGRLENINPEGMALGVLAALMAACSYGVAASFMRRYLSGVDSLAGATGSQISAAALLLIPGVMAWPESNPGLNAWMAVVLLGVFSTGLAYLLYFRLIRSLGAGRAITVTFAIPVFGLFWGALLLDETVSLLMLLGSALVIVGCAYTIGVLPRAQASAKRSD